MVGTKKGCREETIDYEKREKYGLISMAIINGLVSEYTHGSVILKILSALNGFAIWSIILILSVNFLRKNVDKVAFTLKISLLGILWSTSYIAMSVLRNGQFISVLNCIALIAFGFNLHALLKRKDAIRDEEHPIRSGYIWLAAVLTIPFVLIAVILGH